MKKKPISEQTLDKIRDEVYNETTRLCCVPRALVAEELCPKCRQ